MQHTLHPPRLRLREQQALDPQLLRQHPGPQDLVCGTCAGLSILGRPQANGPRIWSSVTVSGRAVHRHSALCKPRGARHAHEQSSKLCQQPAGAQQQCTQETPEQGVYCCRASAAIALVQQACVTLITSHNSDTSLDRGTTDIKPVFT